ncbi:hypothetical protein ACFLXV_04240 [Chloroflexota bacterium]
MPDIKVTTIGKAKAILHEERTRRKKLRKISPVIAEYEDYLMKLERGKAITITLKDGDKYQTIKYRLKTAAKSLGISNLRIERAADKIIFYKEVKPRIRKAARKVVVAKKAAKREREIEPVQELELEPEQDIETVGVEEDASLAELETVPVEDSEEPQGPGEELPADGELLEFEFDEEWEVPMVYGDKTCETETLRYEGDSFKAFGHNYIVTKVEQVTLGEVQQKWFKQHGLFNPREFKEVWKQRHNGEFDPGQNVWMHHFQRGFVPPEEPETNLGGEEDQE